MLRKIVSVAVIGLMFSSTYAQAPVVAKQLCYQSNISYPQVDAGNAVISKFVSRFQAQLTQALVDSGDDATACSQANNITITYQQFTAMDDVISILFQSQMNYQHLAHPITTFMALNYDVVKQRQLTFSDVFIDTGEALTILSSYSQHVLSKALQSDAPSQQMQEMAMQMLEQGSAPTAESYKHWNLLKEGIVITFDPAQVAASYRGKQQVTIPFSELSAVLTPRFAPQKEGIDS
jgi:hypothetical protein